jgi:hypothetical protein
LYPTDTLNDQHGEQVGTGALEVKSVFHAPVIAWVTPYRIGGGHVGGSTLLPFIRNRLQANVLDVDTGLGYTDTALTPINIGWHRARTDVLAGYTLYLPSGKFDAGGRDNFGLGMVGQELSFGGTQYFDEEKLWHAAANLAYEWHTKKNDLDLRVGQIATIEGGVGRRSTRTWAMVCRSSPMWALSAMRSSRSPKTAAAISVRGEIFGQSHALTKRECRSFQGPASRARISCAALPNQPANLRLIGVGGCRASRADLLQ